MSEPLDNLYNALSKVASHLDEDQLTIWTQSLAGPMKSVDIITPKRISMFLSQACEESGGFTELSEDLNYSAVRICQVWHSRFATVNSAIPYARNPIKLANKVYANRFGNGDEASGDGWLFRGRGIFQLTFRDNYTKFANYIKKDVVEVTSWMETPQGAAQAACWFWSTRSNMNSLSDAGDVRSITQRINGGLTGLTSRINSYNIALSSLTGFDIEQPRIPIISNISSADDLNNQELHNLS